MHKFTQAGLEKIISRLGTAVKLLKREKKKSEQAGQKFDKEYAITLFEESHLKFYRKELAKLKREGKESENTEEVTARDTAETILPPLKEDMHISKAAKLLAGYIVNPTGENERKKGPNYVGIERLTLIATGSENKNIFEAWEKEWSIKNFYDNELGVKKQFRCAACGNQASKNVTLTNKKTGAEISFNYQCFDSLISDLGVKLGGVISSLKQARKESADALARQFQDLLENALEKTNLTEAASEINKELPKEYRIFADEKALLKHLSMMYRHFRNEPDFTAGTKEFEPHTSLRNWSRLRLEDNNTPAKIKAAHEKFLSLSKMTTAELLTFIQDYKHNRAVSILENKDTLDDLFLIELKGEANLDPIRHLLKSRITPAEGDKISEYMAQHTQKRAAHNQAMIEKYSEDTLSSALKNALKYYFSDRKTWHEARKNQDEQNPETMLSKKDYLALKKICERLTLGFPKNMPEDFTMQDAKEILLKHTPMLAAQKMLRTLTVMQRKTIYGEKQGNTSGKLKEDYIPAEEFHNFTDIDRRFSLETVLDRIEHSLARTGQHEDFIKNHLPELKQSLEHRLISKEITYKKDSAYELHLNQEQAGVLSSLSKEIKKLSEKITEIHVPQKPGPEKTRQSRKREELTAQKDELIIRRYLALKGDYTQYTLRDTKGNRITSDGRILNCKMKDAFDRVKEFRPVKEYGDLQKKINEIAELLETAPIFLHLPQLSPQYESPAALCSVKYIDDAGIAIITRIHGMLSKPSRDLADSIKAARQEDAKSIISKIEEASRNKIKILDNRGVLSEIMLDYRHYSEPKEGAIKYYRLHTILHDFKNLDENITLAELISDKQIQTALKEADEKTHDILKRTSPDLAGLYRKAAELLAQDTSIILIPKNTQELLKNTAINLPLYEAQARRQDYAKNKTEQEIRAAFVQKVYDKIQAQAEKDKEIYWRLINGQKLYFSRKEEDKGWKENPKYGLPNPDEKYWQEDLMRFLDSTTAGEMKGYLIKPKFKKITGKWVNWSYSYITAVAKGEANHTTWQYRHDIAKKLKQHALQNKITENQAENLFIPASRKLEKLINQALAELA